MLRRISKRNELVTLSEINITPMLDLAFVLLIIFIIATPLMEQGMSLNLPKGGDSGARQAEVKRTIDISTSGQFRLDGRPIAMTAMEQELTRAYQGNTNMVIYIRVDEEGRNKHLYEVIDMCQRHQISRFSLRTRPRTG